MTMQHRFTEQEILTGLPPEVRAQFLALDPAERKFLLTASERERHAYEIMPPEEQTRFAVQPLALRETYMRLGPGEREYARAAAPDELRRFLSLSPTERQAVVKGSPQAAAQRKRTAVLGAQAARLAKEVIATLSPWADGDPSLVEKAAGVAFNQLHAGAADAEAKREALAAVLCLPGPAQALSAELGKTLGDATVSRARPVLPQLVKEAATTATNREQLVAKLKESLASWAAKAGSGSTQDLPTGNLGLRGGHISG